jgi:hypothetical protein
MIKFDMIEFKDGAIIGHIFAHGEPPQPEPEGTHYHPIIPKGWGGKRRRKSRGLPELRICVHYEGFASPWGEPCGD